MSANPSLYSDSFSSSRSPSATFNSISLRLSLHKALTTDLAQYFHDRAQLDALYAASLSKLHSRLHSSGGGSRADKDTVFRELDGIAASLPGGQREADQLLGSAWTQVRVTLEEEVRSAAGVHEQWKRRIEKEVEGPIRDSLGKGEWRAWNAGEGQIGGNVREYEGLVEKVNKAQQKSSTKSSKSASSKLLTTQSHLSSLGSSLSQSLPPFLTQSQSLELSHAAFLKEALVRAGTATSDLGRERMEQGEKLLVGALGVDESAESEEWALREGMRLGGGGGGRNGGGLPSVGEFGETDETSSSRLSAPPARERQDTQSDAASTRSGSTVPAAGVERSRTVSRPPVAPIPIPTPTHDDSRSLHAPSTSEKKSGLGSKLSSMLGSSKSSSNGNARDRSSSIPNSAKYANFASGSGSSFDAPPPVPSLAPPMDRSDSGTSNGGDLLGGSSANYGGGGSMAPLQPTPNGGGGEKRKSFMPSGAGSLFRRQSKMNPMDNFSNNNGGGESPTAASPQEQAASFADRFTAEPQSGGGSGQVDEEGYTVKPEGYDRQIGLGGGGGGGGGGGLMDDDEDEGMNDIPSAIPRLSIAPIPSLSLPSTSSPLTLTSTPKPLFASTSSSIAPPPLSPEAERERLAALEAVKNTLGAPPSASGAAGVGRRNTARGRRSEGGARNTVYGSGSGSGSSAGGGAVAALEPPREEREASVSDDDIPLAQVQQQQQSHRRAPPPPPVSAAGASPSASPALSSLPPSSVSPPLSPSMTSAFAAPSSAFSPSPSLNGVNGGRTMSLLSTTSSTAAGGAASSAISDTVVRADPFADESTPGLRAEVRETVNVLMKGGEVVKVLISGEVAVSYRPSSSSSVTAGSVKLRLTGLEGAEKAVPNAVFLSPSPSSGEYTLKASLLHSRHGPNTTPVLKYQLSLPPSASLLTLIPLTVRPTWRCEPSLSRAIVSYALNPSSPLFAASSAPSSSPFGDDEPSAGGEQVELEDLKIDLLLSPTSPSSIVSFQSKPSTATLLPSGRGLSFALPSLALSSSQSAGAEQKLLASLTTTEGQGAAVPGQVSVQWKVRGRTVGRVGVEVVEGTVEGEGEGEQVREVRRETAAGKYLAH